MNYSEKPKRRNPIAKELFERDKPYRHKTERDHTKYRRPSPKNWRVLEDVDR